MTVNHPQWGTMCEICFERLEVEQCAMDRAGQRWDVCRGVCARQAGIEEMGMRRFVLVRDEDVSGVSGTGVVAEGIEFTDKTVVLRWGQNPHPATAVWDSIEKVEAVHGHQGKTRVHWLDPS